MKTLKFKTNLKCAGCMYAIKPYMDEIKGIQSWDVNLDSPDKEVTVEAETETPKKLSKTIKKAMDKAGYKATWVN